MSMSQPADGYAFNKKELTELWERPEPTWQDVSVTLEKVYTFHLKCSGMDLPGKQDSKNAVKRIIKAVMAERDNPEPTNDCQSPDLRD